MPAPHLSSANGVKPAADLADVPLSLAQRKQRLAETLVKKVEQGFRIESQTERSRRRGDARVCVIAVDEEQLRPAKR